MQLPREVVVGSGVLKLIGEMCLGLGLAGSALIVAGSKTFKVAGGEAADSLRASGLSVDSIIVNNSTMESVRLVEDKIRDAKPSIVLGVGGGKDIDVAKLASANRKTQFMSVPTAASHDGIASPYTSIKGFDRPYSMKAQAPIAIVADVDVIARSPSRLFASGCGDIVSKYTAVRDWKLAHRRVGEYYGSYAANLALMSARLVMKDAGSIGVRAREGIHTVVEALISCGVSMSIAGSTRPCSGAEHLFSHAVDLLAPNSALHGEQCGVGAVMCAYMHGANWKIVRDVLKAVGAPTKAKQLGLSRDQVVEALLMAGSIRPERYTILSEMKLTDVKARRVARVTGVVD